MIAELQFNIFLESDAADLELMEVQTTTSAVEWYMISI